MNSNTPIYYTNIFVHVIKSQTITEIVTVPEVVIKGFTKKHILQHNKNHIYKKLAEIYKLDEKKIAKVEIEFLKQLGFGVDFD